MAELLAAATTDAQSADVTITAGTKSSFFLKPASGQRDIPKTAAIWAQKKTGSDYVDFFLMTQDIDKRAVEFEATTADLVLRFNRGLQDEAVGLDQV